jgi:hypothetical protein
MTSDPPSSGQIFVPPKVSTAQLRGGGGQVSVSAIAIPPEKFSDKFFQECRSRMLIKLVDKKCRSKMPIKNADKKC